MAVKDAIKHNKNEKEEIPSFNIHKNVHFNIPQGNDAKIQYRNLIRNVKSISPKSYGNIEDWENQGVFNEVQTYLIALGEYCEGIEEIHKTKDYIVNDELIIEKSYTIDERVTISALITEEEKELLSELIEAINSKLYQMRNHE